MCKQAGLGGVVCSAHEIRAFVKFVVKSFW